MAILRCIALVLVTAALIAGCPASAWANAAEDVDQGTEAADGGDYDKAVELFTRAIDSRELSRSDAAAAHSKRGDAYQGKSDFSRAIADYDAAIRLDPGNDEAFSSRGDAYAATGDYDRAIADYDGAIRVKRDNPDAYLGRGAARFVLGQFAPAIADLRRSVRLDPANAYAALWLYLAQARSGKADREELARMAGSIDRDAWPGPVVDLYLGDATAEEVRGAAEQDDASGERDQRCEAAFYLGEYELIHGGKTAARPLLEEAARTCTPALYERQGAVAELKRMGK